MRLARFVQRLTPAQVGLVFEAARLAVRRSRWSDASYVPAEGRHWLLDA